MSRMPSAPVLLRAGEALSVAGVPVPLTAFAATVVAANWRVAALALTAALVIRSTRIRYAAFPSAALLLAVAGLAAVGRTAGSDPRPHGEAKLVPNGRRWPW